MVPSCKPRRRVRQLRSSRWRAIALASGVLALPGLPVPASASTAEAAARHDATCTLSATVHFSPGVSLLRKVTGGGTTQGLTGAARCTGTAGGSEITGPGAFGYAGSFEDITCLADRVPLRGDYRITLPTEEGTVTLQGTIVDARIAVGAWFTLVGTDHRLDGPALVLNRRGDCVLNPVTQASVTIVGVLTSA